MSSSVNMSEKDALLAQHIRPYYSGLAEINECGSSTDSEAGVIVKTGAGPEDPRVKGIPLIRAMFVVANAALGAGMLNFPQAYAQAGGIANALAIQFSMLVFIVAAFLILAYCADKHGSQNYQEVVSHMLGPVGFYSSQFLVMIYMYGASIAFLILIGDQMERVLEVVTHSTPHWYTSRAFTICSIACVLILPLCLPRRLSGALSYSSVFGGIGAVYICAVVCFKHFKGTYPNQPVTKAEMPPWTDAFSAIPVLCFAFQCHVTSVAVYAELKYASIRRFAIVVIGAMCICTFAYSLTGCFGFLTFGMKTESDVLLNYKADDIEVGIARVMIAAIVISTYAIVHFCGRTAVEGLWIAFRRMTQEQAENSERPRRVVQTLVWFGTSLVVAVKVPTIGVAIALVGGVAALFIFFYPGLCLIKAMVDTPVWDKKSIFLVVVGVLFVVIAVFLFAVSEVLAITKDISAKNIM